MQRVVTVFPVSADNVVAVFKIPAINLEQLQALFNVRADNPMFDCFLIETTEQIQWLKDVLNLEVVDTTNYQWFLECQAV